jgi:hypothetical protein
MEYPGLRRSGGLQQNLSHHVRNELVCHTLKGKYLTTAIKAMVADMEEPGEAWETLDTCYNHPENYLTVELEPIVKILRYKVYEHAAIREFYSLLRAAMIVARGV